jgi:hypothetical protein
MFGFISSTINLLGTKTEILEWGAEMIENVKESTINMAVYVSIFYIIIIIMMIIVLILLLSFITGLCLLLFILGGRTLLSLGGGWSTGGGVDKGLGYRRGA